MKTLLYIIPIFVLISCKPKTKPDTINSTTKVQEFDKMLLDSLCKITISSSSGEFIKMDEAWGKLEMYKKFREDHATSSTPYDRKTDIYGFVFGIDKLKELLQKIDTINKRAQKDSLVGVRIYYARTRINIGQEIPEVFLIPVSPDKNNVYPVDDDFKKSPLTEERLILNTSVPCPNQCH